MGGSTFGVLLPKGCSAGFLARGMSSLLAIAFVFVCGTMPAWADPSDDLIRDDERVFRFGGRDDHDRRPGDDKERVFRRIATFPVFLNTDINVETVSEIVAASEDGRVLIYTDSATGNVGFVNIDDPHNPLPAGVVPVGGSPTSVSVAGKYALVAVNTSPSFANPSGNLKVIDMVTREILRTIELDGQPDCVAVSPDRRYAAIAIENERDEDLGDGRPPQTPPGFVVIVDVIGSPANWTTRNVNLVGFPDLFPEDPEPEFIDINRDNIAAVTLQENNHIALIDLKTGKVIKHFSAKAVDLENIDAIENQLIELNGVLSGVLREPDAVAWVSNDRLATADEGDLDGGSRGFSIFDKKGEIRFASGNLLERLVARLGHYPEDRSESAGNEPEGMELGIYEGDHGHDRLLFVGSERSSVIFVYDLDRPRFGRRFDREGLRPRLVQILPTGAGPEGLLAIPQRDLFVVASEVDSREDKIRSSITIYKRERGRRTYPTILSANRENGSPIPWAALSALTANPYKYSDTVYAAYDSFFRESRIFGINVKRKPAIIKSEIVLNDSTNVLRDALLALKEALPASATNDFDPNLAINTNGTANLDVEGLAIDEGGYFWVASEGAGNLVNGVSNPDDQPFESPNLIARVANDGTIKEVVLLPLDLNNNQFRFGFEGVAAAGRFVYVAFQREWQSAGDPANLVRIGRYDRSEQEWRFFYYPLDLPTSPNGGWVGLSEIAVLGKESFAVIERDDQGGPDARIKKIYQFSIAGLEPQPHGGDFPVVEKTLVRDLIPDLKGDNGPVLEKVEGFTVLYNGDALIVTDNDGVSNSSGETQFIRIKKVFEEIEDT
jgi:Esterase-like activity of phytase